ncbi:MAG: universal stress protein [Anaerolineae bacterium]|nr:universal stress protein [Anaerolineae bacterium]
MSGKMRILIAYDGSSCADAALDDLRRAGLPAEAEALVLSVADVWPPTSSDGAPPALDDSLPPAVKMARVQAIQAVQAAETLAHQAARIVKSLFPGWDVRSEAMADSPAWAIIKRADQWPADLIILGSHGHSALHRFVLGSVSQKVLTEARCSVRIARERRREGPLRLVVGVDGSPGADLAVQTMARRDWPPDSQALVVAVMDTRLNIEANAITPSDEGWVEASHEEAVHWIDETVGRAADQIRNRGLRVETLLGDGDAKHVLIEQSESWDADCVFVGASGMTRRSYMVLGSVSTAVAARASCSVEVVRKAS